MRLIHRFIESSAFALSESENFQNFYDLQNKPFYFIITIHFSSLTEIYSVKYWKLLELSLKR